MVLFFFLSNIKIPNRGNSLSILWVLVLIRRLRLHCVRHTISAKDDLVVSHFD